MDFLKFVIPFVGGALTAVAAGFAIKKKTEKIKPNKSIEIDVEYEEKVDETNNKEGE